MRTSRYTHPKGKMNAVLLALALLSPSAFATLPDHCAKYSNNEKYVRAISVVARNMGYGPKELCALPRLADIHVTGRTLVNENQELVPHIWVTLHYSEHSCQYFLREADFVTTQKNCYNTW